MSRDATRELLLAIGYQVRFRDDQWVECLIAGDGAVFHGAGLDRTAAFDAALDALLPTPLARRLFSDFAQTRTGGGRAVVDPREAERAPVRSEASLDSVPPPSPNEISVSRRFEEAVARAVEPIEPPAPGQIAVILSRPVTPRPGTLAAAEAPPPSPPAAPAPLSLAGTSAGGVDYAPASELPLTGSVDESLDALDILLDRVRDSREELGLCSPERQRLAMLAWICEARSHTDSFPEDLRIRDRVGAISRLLTEIGKTFWPGSVTALQLHMQPRDLPRHLLGGTATTWHRAAELAEQSLRTRELEDERRGYDAYGWADAKQLSPRPAEPARLLQGLIAEVERLSGPISTQAPPPDASIRPDSGSFLRWVRQLRWLRGWDVDPDLWARIAGRFRWWAFRRDPTLAIAARELEAGFAPAQSWASLLGQDPEVRKQQRRLREILSQPPRIEPEDAAPQLLSWLVNALPFGDTHHGNIVRLMEPYRELVLDLSPDALPEADRRLRRRLVRLQEDLQSANGTAKPAPLPELPTDAEPSVAVDDLDPPLPPDLLRRVRGVTEGKRTVLVSQRRDPELQASLQHTFGFASLDCKIAEMRRVQALGEAIEDGQYDVVLVATGFQLPALDQTLARACRSAQVAFVRVHRAGPLTLLRALARDLGSRALSA